MISFLIDVLKDYWKNGNIHERVLCLMGVLVLSCFLLWIAVTILGGKVFFLTLMFFAFIGWAYVTVAVLSND